MGGKMERGILLDGRYRMVCTLGKGGMSTVYLAENIKLGTLWAIKEIPKRADSKIDMLVEPNILKKLNHPALPRIYDIIDDSNYIFIIVDYIDGTSLDKELARVGKFPENTVISWADQICDVLRYLHNFKPNPIIYRDMKPSNIMLTSEGNIKLIDFGIAREYKAQSDNDTVYIGTRGYAAPEQYGGGQTNIATDIYNLGVTLYHLLTGKNPNGPPYEIKPVRHFDESLSDEIEQIILKCTKQNPYERYKSVDELKEDLNNIGKTSNDEKNDSLKAEAAHSNGINPTFKRLVLTIWNNAEFACELAYVLSKHTSLNVLLADLDLLAPKADLYLNVKKYPERITVEGMPGSTGLNMVMDIIERGSISAELISGASVKRNELRNLFVLTGNYKLDNYEYYSDDNLIKFIDKAYQGFDITILAVNKSIYDSFTVISLARADYNIIPLRADIDNIREYNSYLVFLKEKQNVPLEKSKFVAFEYDSSVNLSAAVLNEVTGHNYLGSVRYSKRRARYRNLKVPYAKRIEKPILYDYMDIMSKLNISRKTSMIDRFSNWANGILRTVQETCRKCRKTCGEVKRKTCL
jgi:cellulose biosynthesis protein BcsQ